MERDIIEIVKERLLQAQSILQEDANAECVKSGNGCDECIYQLQCDLIAQAIISIE